MRICPARAFVPAVALLAMTSGCTSSGPYWSREDQGAALSQEQDERAARLAVELAAEKVRNSSLQAELERLARELARLREPGAESEPGELAKSSAALPPEGLEAPETTPVPGVGASQKIEQSDLELGEEPAAPEELYERSLELLEQGRLAEAEVGFTRFLVANPLSDLADNAQFWLAESALRRADVATALAGFRAVVENYPEGNKVPDALLKVGFCLGEMGEPESAAVVYSELLERFPDTPAAEAARQRLGLQ